ncbi:MAG: hypothetical protein AAFQ41_12665 [Cyanobacteria bacterium J06623_7]
MQTKSNKNADLVDDLSSPAPVYLSKNEGILSLINYVYRLYIYTLSLVSSKSSLLNIYLPFSYLERVKRKNEKYTLKVILWDDVPLLVLAFSWSASNPLIHIVGIISLLISFWCVYELGYYENDRIAEQYESQPKLSPAYYSHRQMMNTALPWLWSLGFGWVGIILLEQAQVAPLSWTSSWAEAVSFLNPTLLTYSTWLLFLICMRCCFRVYNYVNKQTRTWLYIVLQSFRYYGFLAVTATNLIGITLLSSQILSRSLLYIVYRYSGGNCDNWPKEIPEKLLRGSIFIFMLTSICLGSQSLELWQSWQTWAIVSWCVVQGQGQVIRMLSQVKLVLHDGSN